MDFSYIKAELVRAVGIVKINHSDRDERNEFSACCN